jgi:hypothetical protein
VDTIRTVGRVRERRQHEDVSDVGVVVDALEDNHDGTVPTVVPVRLAAEHRGHDQDLEEQITCLRTGHDTSQNSSIQWLVNLGFLL